MTILEILTPSPTTIDLSRAGTRVRSVLSSQSARRAATQKQLARASPTHRVAAIMIFIMIGILIAMLTTPDPLWWQLHFSELGTFEAFSSYVFNGTLILTGASIVAFARYFRHELIKHVARSGSWRGSPRVVSTLFGSLGLHLAFVGGVPVNTVTFIHDRGAQGMVFSFLAILIVVPSLLRGLGRALAAITFPAIVLLVGGGVSMVMGIINLAFYELLGFAVMFTWVLLFVACLGRHETNHARAELAAPRPAAPRPATPHIAPSRRRRASTQRRAQLRTADRQFTFVSAHEGILWARDNVGCPTVLGRSSLPWTYSAGAQPVRNFAPDAAPYVIETAQRSMAPRRLVRRVRTTAAGPARQHAGPSD
ncbi:DUF998 domain-containing protein [uncultured Microbacterium sp.]|uniref:DUF998 domain-containing protein n=1 Tax=uncultured Microbacterium sp. TaxID=191216 RepID=UPI0035CC944E